MNSKYKIVVVISILLVILSLSITFVNYFVSSMMANDTFVQDWILEEEIDPNKIKQYLSSVKNKYGMFTSFLVSELMILNGLMMSLDMQLETEF